MVILSVSNKPEKETINNVNWDKLMGFLEKMDKTNYLAELAIKEPHLQIEEPIVSDFLYFRYIFPRVEELDLEGINRMILNEMWKTGRDIIEEDIIRGKYFFFFCNIKEFSYSELDILIEQITTIGNVLVKEYL